MADAEFGSAERTDDGWSPRNPTVTRRLRVLPRSYWLLLAIFVVLQVADVLTTNSALAIAGNWEANPIMASYQAQWGAAWWLPKAAGVGWICVAGPLVQRWWPMILAVSYSFVVVAGNLAAL
jgi:hypothetical protein